MTTDNHTLDHLRMQDPERLRSLAAEAADIAHGYRDTDPDRCSQWAELSAVLHSLANWIESELS